MQDLVHLCHTKQKQALSVALDEFRSLILGKDAALWRILLHIMPFTNAGDMQMQQLVAL